MSLHLKSRSGLFALLMAGLTLVINGPATAQQAPASDWISVASWATHPVPAKIAANLSRSLREEEYQIRQNPDDTKAWGKLSVLQFTLGYYERSAHSFQQLLLRQPTFPFAYAQYMQALYLSGDPDTVRWLLAQDVDLQAAPLPTEMLAAQLDFDVRDYSRARDHLTKALEHTDDPDLDIDDRNRMRLKVIVLRNLIHVSRLLKDEATADQYRIKLIKIRESVQP